MPDSNYIMPDLETLFWENYVVNKLYGYVKDRKDRLAKTMEPGDKKEVVNPQGIKLGSISKSQPLKKAVCTDVAILFAQADAEGMELIDVLPETESEKGREIIRILLAIGRQDLLDVTMSLDDHKKMADKVLQDWQLTGELAQGWEIKDASSPRLTITTGRSTTAKAAIKARFKQIMGGIDMPSLQAVTEIEGKK